MIEEQCTCKVGEPYNNLFCKVHGNISKEEPKTLSKVELAKNIAVIGIGREPKQQTLEEAFKAGAKWQAERMYSEEEIRKAIQEAIALMRYKATEFREHENTIIEQFKKKS